MIPRLTRYRSLTLPLRQGSSEVSHVYYWDDAYTQPTDARIFIACTYPHDRKREGLF